MFSNDPGGRRCASYPPSTLYHGGVRLCRSISVRHEVAATAAYTLLACMSRTFSVAADAVPLNFPGGPSDPSDWCHQKGLG